MEEALWTRRGLVVAGGVAVLAACSGTGGEGSTTPPPSSGAASGSGGVPTASTTTSGGAEVDPAAQAAVFGESAHGQRFRVLSTGRLPGTTPAQKAWAAGHLAACTARAQVLNHVDPLSADSPTLPPAQPSPVVATPVKTLAEAMTAIQASAKELSGQRRQRAMDASQPDEVLLWASLAVAAQVSAVQGPAPVAALRLPRHFEARPGIEARQNLLAHLHRAVWAVEACIGVLPSGPERTALREVRLNALTQTRDRVSGGIRAEGETPVAPEPGYQLPQRPTATTARLVAGAVSGDLMAAWLAVAATSDQTVRDEAISRAIAEGTLQARALPTPHWPGWI